MRDGKTPPGRYQGQGTRVNWWTKCKGRVGALKMSMNWGLVAVAPLAAAAADLAGDVWDSTGEEEP